MENNKRWSVVAEATSISILALVALVIVVPAVRRAQLKQDHTVDLFITIPGDTLRTSYMKLLTRCARAPALAPACRSLLRGCGGRRSSRPSGLPVVQLRPATQSRVYRGPVRRARVKEQE